MWDYTNASVLYEMKMSLMPKIRDSEFKECYHLVVGCIIADNFNPINKSQLLIYKKKFEWVFPY